MIGLWSSWRRSSIPQAQCLDPQLKSGPLLCFFFLLPVVQLCQSCSHLFSSFVEAKCPQDDSKYKICFYSPRFRVQWGKTSIHTLFGSFNTLVSTNTSRQLCHAGLLMVMRVTEYPADNLKAAGNVTQRTINIELHCSHFHSETFQQIRTLWEWCAYRLQNK